MTEWQHDDDGWDDSYDEEDDAAYDPRVTAMLEEAEAHHIAGQVYGHIDELAQQAGVNLTARQRDAIFREAVSGESPDPDVTEAVFGGWAEDHGWGGAPGDGGAGSRDWADRNNGMSEPERDEARVNAMAQIADEEMARQDTADMTDSDESEDYS